MRECLSLSSVCVARAHTAWHRKTGGAKIVIVACFLYMCVCVDWCWDLYFMSTWMIARRLTHTHTHDVSTAWIKHGSRAGAHKEKRCEHLKAKTQTNGFGAHFQTYRRSICRRAATTTENICGAPGLLAGWLAALSRGLKTRARDCAILIVKCVTFDDQAHYTIISSLCIMRGRPHVVLYCSVCVCHGLRAKCDSYIYISQNACWAQRSEHYSYITRLKGKGALCRREWPSAVVPFYMH